MKAAKITIESRLASVKEAEAPVPHIGYEKAAFLAREAYDSHRPVRDIVREHHILTDAQIEHFLSPWSMTHPGITGEGEDTLPISG